MNIQAAKPINDAIKLGDLQQLKLLLDEHPEAIRMETPWGSWLHVAAQEGKLEIVQELVRRGMEVNARGGTLRGNAMQHAAHSGHVEIIRFLLDHGAEIDVSASRYNPLFAAILDDNAEIAKLLIDRGIDVTVKYNSDTMRDMDAIAFAEKHGAEKCLKLLKKCQGKETSIV